MRLGLLLNEEDTQMLIAIADDIDTTPLDVISKAIETMFNRITQINEETADGR